MYMTWLVCKLPGRLLAWYVHRWLGGYSALYLYGYIVIYLVCRWFGRFLVWYLAGQVDMYVDCLVAILVSWYLVG